MAGFLGWLCLRTPLPSFWFQQVAWPRGLSVPPLSCKHTLTLSSPCASTNSCTLWTHWNSVLWGIQMLQENGWERNSPSCSAVHWTSKTEAHHGQQWLEGEEPGEDGGGDGGEAEDPD